MECWERQTNGGAPSRPHTAPAHQRLRNRNRKGKEAEDAIQRQEDVELQQLGRENHYGNEIGRLGRAVKMAREGSEFMKSEGFVKSLDGPASLGNLSNNLQSLLVNTKQRRKVIVNENNTIYHEQVPDSEKMAKIQGKDMMEYDEKDINLPSEMMPESLARPMFANILR